MEAVFNGSAFSLIDVVERSGIEEYLALGSEGLSELHQENLRQYSRFLDLKVQEVMDDETFLASLEQLISIVEQDLKNFPLLVRKRPKLKAIEEEWQRQSKVIIASYEEASLYLEDGDLDHLRVSYFAIETVLKDRDPLYVYFD